jgi:hypothetical protein
MTTCSIRQRELTSLIDAAIASSRAECPFGQLVSTMGVVITADLQAKK